MAEPSSEGLYEVFFSLHDPRQSGKVQHGLAETLVIIVCGLLLEPTLWLKLSFGPRKSRTGCSSTFAFLTGFLRTIRWDGF